MQDIKHRALRAICSRLKIKGVKNTSKDSMLEKIVSVYKLKERYGRLTDDEDRVSYTDKRGAPVPLQIT